MKHALHTLDQKIHALVVDDDERLLNLTTRYLIKNGVIVNTAHNALEASKLLDYLVFDMIILDVMMPGEDGFSLTKRLRCKGIETPILFLTAKTESEDRIEGLQVGADDYLTKPFEPQELLLRVQAILKRTSQKKQSLTAIRFAGYQFDTEREQLTDGARIINLTSVEAGLLKILAEKPGEIHSRDVLAERTGQDPLSRTIDVQITRLRKKIEKNPKVPQYLQTIRGKGYVLRPDYDDE